MHNILTKKLGDLLKLNRQGGVSNSPDTYIMSIPCVELHFKIVLNISLTNDQSNCSILSRDHNFI